MLLQDMYDNYWSQTADSEVQIFLKKWLTQLTQMVSPESSWDNNDYTVSEGKMSFLIWSWQKYMQGRNHRENLGATVPMVGRICAPGWNRVKLSENLGRTAVVLVAPVDTSVKNIGETKK